MRIQAPVRRFTRRARAVRVRSGAIRGSSLPLTAALARSSSLSSKIVSDVLLSLVLSLACAFAFWSMIKGVFLERWMLDFRYFWTAGRLWLEGVSPYGPAYLENGEAVFGSFPNPFFYPPNVLPFFAVLGAFEPRQAAVGFLVFNMLLIGVYAACLSDLAIRMGFAGRRLTTFALVLPFASLLYHPTQAAVVYGQPAFLLAAALMAFVYGAGAKRKWLAATGLAGLLIKPQFFVGFVLLTLIRKEFRAIALPALILTAALSLAGLCAGDPVDNIRQFVSNVSAYGDAHWNESEFSAGLGHLLGFVNIPVSTATSLGGGLIASLAASRMLGDNPTDMPRLVMAATLMVSLSIIVSPNHPNDFVLVLTAIPLTLSPISKIARLFLVTAFLLLVGTIPTVLPMTGMAMDQKLSLIAGSHTFALFVVAGTVATVGFRATTRSERRPDQA